MTIGQTLSAAREDAGLSVDQVAASTRIRRALVVAIEDDDFAPCGGDFYARGHIRNIAATVGTDPEPLLEEFDASRAGPVAPRATEVFESETAARADRRGPNWTAAMAVALVLVVIYGVAQAVTGGSGKHTPTTAAGPASSATVSPGRPSASPSARKPTANPSAVAQAPRSQVTVSVQATGKSWLRVTTASGRELFQGILLAGQVKSFTDKSQVRLVVGNAGAVTLTVNGTTIGTPGKDGQVARVQFGPQDPAAG